MAGEEGAPLGIGVVGGGSIAEWHLGSYAKNPDARIVAVADVDLSRAQARAAQYTALAAELGRDQPPVRAVGSHTELLADPEVEAVSVCTRNDTHASVAVDVLASGRSALVEKPMARTVAEAEAIVAAEAASDGVVQVGYVRRWSPNAQVLKAFADAGDLGEVYYAKATCLRQAGNPGGWFADRSISGGGPLIDVGVHFLDLAWWFMGAPRAVAVSGYTSDRLGNRGNIESLSRWKSADYDVSKNSVEDLAGAVVRFEGGAVLHLDVSYSLHGRPQVGLALFGERGGAELEPELTLFTERHDTITEVVPHVDSRSFAIVPAFQNEIDGFVRAARGLEPSIAPAAHGLEAVRIVTAVYESAAKGTEITL